MSSASSVRLLRLTFIVLSILIILSLSTIVYGELIGKRHDQQLISNVTSRKQVSIPIEFQTLDNITSTLLSRYSDKLDPLTLMKIKEIKEDIKNNNIIELSRDLEELKIILKDNSSFYANKPDDLKSLLALLAAHKITKENDMVTISIDQNELSSLLHLFNTSINELSDMETINTLLRLASLMKSINPEYSSLLSSIAQALMRGDYLTASRLYSKAYGRLGDALAQLLKEGIISEDELKDILKKMPTFITNDGKIAKAKSDLLEQIFRENKKQASIEEREQVIREEQEHKPLLGFNEISNLKNIDLVSPSIPNLRLLPQINVLYMVIAVIIILLVVFVLRVKPVKIAINKYTSIIRSKLIIKRIERKIDTRLHPVIKYYILTLEIMRRKGLPKLHYETPREYLSRIKGRMEYDVLRTITYIYEKVKYGNKQVSKDEVEACKEGYYTISKWR